jgi:zinc protease
MRALTVALLLCGAAHLPAQPLDLRASLPRDTAVRTDSLPNGVRLIARRVREPAGRIELRLLVDAGSALERDDERGAAHLIEHLAFEGTTSFSRDSLRFLLSRLGQSGGAHANATTTADETVYKLSVPSVPAALDAGLGILAEWALPLPVDSGALQRQRPIVLEEWRQGRSAQSRVADLQQSVLLAGTRYLDRSPIGTDSSIRTVSLAQLHAFRARWYRPARMRVLIVGDVDPTMALAAARRSFARVPSAPIVADTRLPPTTMPRVAGRALLLTDAELTTRGVSMVYPVAARPARTVGDYRGALAASLAIEALQRRLQERSAQSAAPFAAAGVEQGKLARPLAVLALTAGVAAQPTDPAPLVRDAAAGMTIELRRLATYGITAGERDRLMARLISVADGEARAVDRIPSSNWTEVLQSASLSGDAILHPTDRLELLRRVLPTISAATIDSVARELSQATPLMVVRAPARDRAALTDTSRWAGAVRDARTAALVPYVDSAAVGALVDPAPVAGRIVEEQQWSASGVTEWRLSNGMRVWLKPTTGRAALVRVRLLGVGGLSLASDSAYPSAALSAATADVSGLGKFSRVALGNRLSTLTLQLGTVIGGLSAAISGAAEPKDLETLFSLLHLAASQPRRDSVAWATLLDRQRAVLRDRSADPARALGDTIASVLSRAHPRARPLSADDLSRASLDSALAFYRARFGDASDLTLIVVGRFTPAELRPFIERYAASLAGRGPRSGVWNWRSTWRDVGISAPSRPTETVVRRGTDPRSESVLVFTGPLTWSRRTTAGLAVLGDILGGRLQRRLREAMGGTYGVNVAAGTTRAPREEATVTVRFASAPERAEELAREVLFAADSLQRYGVTPEEVRGATAARQRQTAEARLDDRFWLEGLSAAAEFNESPEGVVAAGKELDDVQPADMRELARRVLDVRRLHRFTLLPASP